MDDDDASPASNLRPRRPGRQLGTLDHDRIPSSSYDRTDPGADASLLSAFTPDATPAPRSSDDVEPLAHRSPHLENLHDDDNKRRSRGPNRTHNSTKQRSSGAFLLPDPVANCAEHDAYTQTQPHRRHRDSQDRSHQRGSRLSSAQTPGSVLERTRPADRGSTGSAITKGESLAGETAVGTPPRASMAPLDVDAAQIVKMALNLSESRRLASRRNVSQPIPPKLAPLPDAPAGGSLRQHLQQQRRVSRTISPKPDRSPRIGPPRVTSPLQPAFEPDGTYRYHFSQSTLARAQKAKEYLELMAQYRRVLDLLPPLKPPSTARSSTVSPPGTPNDSVQVLRLPSNELEPKIGRQYDPLQYIRNRKVRARERKVIDGENQGFSDVVRVSEWIDDVSRWVATGQTRVPGNAALPPYTTADAVIAQGSPPSTSSRPVVASTKSKRPRVDWALHPADMLADIYWLEQDDNKKLVEDRHWRRVFPQDTDLYRPLSREESGLRVTPPGSTAEPAESQALTEKAASDPLPHKHEHEHSLSTARDRAQQKLRALRGSHHRHTSSIQNRDVLRIHRGSLSESSDTDNDLRRRARNGTISSSGKAILAKQMDEMIAQEQQENESHPFYDHEALRMKFTGPSLMTPEREKPRNSPVPSRANSHQRTDSRAELSEAEKRPLKLPSRPSPPQAPPGRASLEVPQRARRLSVDYDTSQPNSPDLRPLRDSALVPAIGSMDLSPTSSRPSSPMRNPLSKVKSIFRDKSRERLVDINSHSGEDSAEFPIPPVLSAERILESPAEWSGARSSERLQSISPPRKVTPGSHRSHRSIGSVKLRGEDGGVGLRSLFRGPRIDSVLRSSVSKVSDMIWRKESGGAGDELSSSTSSDDSDLDRTSRGRSRGRSKGSLLPSRTASRRGNDIDVTSQFLSPTTQTSPGAYPSSRPVSRRSSRFDLLKPPRIDVQDASPSASPPPERVRPQDLDISESESRKSVNTDAARAADARLNAALALPKPRQSPAMSSRHWSIPDVTGAPAAARAAVSKREIARLRALILSYGVHAMEMDRRAKKRRLLASSRSRNPSSSPPRDAADGMPPSDAFAWSDVAALCPDPDVRARLLTRPVAQAELYPLAGRVLGASIQASAEQWRAASGAFAAETAPALERRVEALRNKVAGELTGMTQAAAEEADEANQDLVAGQRLKVKRVVDVMEKMLRRRRRRFRWVRRAGWLAVEWVLVGFMWYVWFVVMLARIVLGVGKGAVRAVRWLLWL